jgi:hypothetical protein
MKNISKEAKDYVLNLLKKCNAEHLIPNSGTEVGNIKSELLKRHGSDFIKKYDLLIDDLAQKRIYG